MKDGNNEEPSFPREDLQDPRAQTPLNPTAPDEKSVGTLDYRLNLHSSEEPSIKAYQELHLMFGVH